MVMVRNFRQPKKLWEGNVFASVSVHRVGLCMPVPYPWVHVPSGGGYAWSPVPGGGWGSGMSRGVGMGEYTRGAGGVYVSPPPYGMGSGISIAPIGTDLTATTCTDGTHPIGILSSCI